jgi:hypothetical protein
VLVVGRAGRHIAVEPLVTHDSSVAVILITAWLFFDGSRGNFVGVKFYFILGIVPHQ